jgi:MFS family permease
MRLLLGISIFWLALSMLQDGINTLVLPVQLSNLGSKDNQATLLGLLTFAGLLGGAIIQPVAGVLSDRLKPLLGRKGFIGIGLLLSLASLAVLALFRSLAGAAIAYLAVQVAASFAQAGQQGLIPDLVDEPRRGLASGFKGFMDIGGAMIGFVILGQLLGDGRPVFGIIAVGAALLATYLIAVLFTPEDRAKRNQESQATVPLQHAFHLDMRHEGLFVRVVLSRFLFLLGIYATGRFLLYFVADRLGLDPNQAAEKAGMLLASLALITVLASPLTGWLADRMGRTLLMISGSVLGAVSALLLVRAGTATQILLFGGLMSIASAAFAGGSWALLADLVPRDQSARYFGLANFGTAGAAAVAGLFGPLMDWADRLTPGSRFTILFFAAALAFAASALPLLSKFQKEVKNAGERNQDQGQVRTNDPGLAVLPIPADPAAAQEDKNPQGGSARL